MAWCGEGHPAENCADLMRDMLGMLGMLFRFREAWLRRHGATGHEPRATGAGTTGHHATKKLAKFGLGSGHCALRLCDGD